MEEACSSFHKLRSFCKKTRPPNASYKCSGKGVTYETLAKQLCNFYAIPSAPERPQKTPVTGPPEPLTPRKTPEVETPATRPPETQVSGHRPRWPSGFFAWLLAWWHRIWPAHARLKTQLTTSPDLEEDVEILGPMNADVVAKNDYRVILFGEMHTPIPEDVPSHNMNILQFMTAADRFSNVEIFIEDTLFLNKNHRTSHSYYADKVTDLYCSNGKCEKLPDSDDFYLTGTETEDTLSALRVFFSPCILGRVKETYLSDSTWIEELCPVRARVHTLDIRFKSIYTNNYHKTVDEADDMGGYDIDDLNMFIKSLLEKDIVHESDISNSKYKKSTQILYRTIKCLLKSKGTDYFEAILSWFFPYNTKENIYGMGDEDLHLPQPIVEWELDLQDHLKARGGVKDDFYKREFKKLKLEKRKWYGMLLGVNLFDVYSACRICRYLKKNVPIIVYVGDDHRKRLTQFFEMYLNTKAISAKHMHDKCVKFKHSDLKGFLH